MKRTIGVAVAVALSMGMMTSASASTPKLSSELLSVGQMPTGWNVDNSSSGGGGCGILEPKGVKQTASAEVTLDNSGSTPLIVEKLATYTNAETAYKKIIAMVNSCKQPKGQKVTFERMSFPNYGNASAAFVTKFIFQGFLSGDDLLIARKGNIIMAIQYVDLNPVYTPWFQGSVVKALAKVK